MNLSAAEMSLMNEEEFPVKTGSLPFKKRRFPRLELIGLNTDATEDRDHAGLHSLAFATCEDRAQFPGSSDEKIAALALVAAAACGTGENATPSSDPFITASTDMKLEEPKKHGFSLFDNQGIAEHPDSTNGTQPTSLNSALAAAAADLQSLHDAIPGKRVHRPPLKSPLPNGCHGRTSRNNSYCRRHPCYKGSKYCKLHYQHCIASGAATEKELMCGVVVEAVEESGDVSDDNLLIGSDGTKAQVNSLAAGNHQDKRYTGATAEVRCKATTTRGRDCSYCAVNGTKYCYLHADYDTNPPPRRGGACNGSVSKNKESGTEPDTLNPAVSSSKQGKPAKTDGPKRKNASSSSRRLSTTKNLEKHMAGAPYPLLSTLATDKWLSRKVIVSTGPLTNHVGLVEKWGNGWVSVRLPGVGLHNRRSFELYLHPNPESESGSASTDSGSEKVEVFDTSQEGASGTGIGLGRSGAGGNCSPPTPMLADKPALDCTTVHEVTPLTSCRVIGIDQTMHKNGNNKCPRRISSIMFPTCMDTSPTTVPESPVPTQGHQTLTLSEDKELQLTAMPTDEGKFGLGVKSSRDEKDNEMPLVQSLMMAQKGRAAKHKMGLLFGTAALERSRRNIHKPVRYEDTELIAKKLKKRDRDSLEDGDSDGPVKRHRDVDTANDEGAGLGPTSVVTSSDEENSAVSA